MTKVYPKYLSTKLENQEVRENKCTIVEDIFRFKAKDLRNKKVFTGIN